MTLQRGSRAKSTVTFGEISIDSRSFDDAEDVDMNADVETNDVVLAERGRAATLRAADVGEDIGTKEGHVAKATPRSWTDVLLKYTHLGLFGMLGCLLRIKLQAAVAGTSGALGASDSALFDTLLGNMLGSFIIGALCTARALNRKTDPGYNPLAFISGEAVWIQKNSVLQLGLRTGFCGALTTFATWNQQMVSMLLEGTSASILGAFFGYGVGILLCTSSVMLGEDIASLLTDWHSPSNKPADVTRHNSLDRWSESSEAFEDVNIVQGGEHGATFSFHVQPNMLETGRKRRSILAAKSWVQDAEGKHAGTVRKVQGLVVALFIIFYAVAAVHFGAFSATDDSAKAWKLGGDVSRARWLSLLLAPFGTVLRYELADLNSRVPHFFVGTFVANVLACLVSAVVYGIRDGSYPEPDLGGGGGSGWGYIIPTAIGTGFCGCLSTVSTFMAEIVKLSPYDPNHAFPKAAYQYAALTIGVSCAVTLAIYGPLKTIDISR